MEKSVFFILALLFMKGGFLNVLDLLSHAELDSIVSFLCTD